MASDALDDARAHLRHAPTFVPSIVLLRLCEAMDAELAAWTWSGLRYCVVHHGVIDVDEDRPCDFWMNDHDHRECKAVDLRYREDKP